MRIACVHPVLVVSLLAAVASADPARSMASMAGGTTGYLAAYADITAPCKGGTIDNPGTCTTTAQPRAVFLDDQGAVTSGPLSIGASSGTYQPTGNVVSAGDLGWLVDLGAAPLFVATDGTTSAASPSLGASPDYSQWCFVGDGWWSAASNPPTLTHLALDGSTLAQVRVGTATADVIGLDVRDDGTMLVAWSAGDAFFAQRFTSTGESLGASFLRGLATHTSTATALRVTATSAGWLVSTQADEGAALTFVSAEGDVTVHALAPGSGPGLAEATPTGALWFELDTGAATSGGSPLGVASIGADGASLGAALTPITILPLSFSIAARDDGFMLLQQSSAAGLTFIALDIDGKLVGRDQILAAAGCNAAPGGARGSCFSGVLLVAFALGLGRARRERQ